MREHLSVSGDVTHTTLLVLFTALLIAATFWILSPFLVPILWASVIAIAMWPLLLRLEVFLGGRRGLATTIMTVTILLAVFVPITLAVFTIVRNAQGITADVRSLNSIALPAPPGWIERVPIAGERVATEWTRFAAMGPDERSATLMPYLQTALRWFAVKAGSLGGLLLQFILTTIIAAIFFAKGDTVREGILRFARRLAGRRGYDVAILAARSIRGVVLGVVLTALIQVAIGAAGLLIAGIPAPGLLSAMMLVLCLCQLGPLLVLVPAVIWVYWSGSAVVGTILLLIGLVAGTIDNFIRPVLIKRGADLPLLLIFAGVIGGLIAFGIIGLFVGPVILAVTYTLLSAWVAEGGESPQSAVGPLYDAVPLRKGRT